MRLIDRTSARRIVQQYRQAVQRILLLDYDGTLVPFARRPERAVPGASILARVERLAADAKNTLVIVSGRQQEFLDRWFGALPIVLVAEHGALLRRPGAAWTSAVDPDPAWKQQVLPVLQRYVDRCTGAFIEAKSLSLVWHYRNADPGLALSRSQELKEELRELVSHDRGLQVMEGHKVLEVKRSGYDKGTTAAHLLTAGAYDFILALGDDRTDEDLFRALGDRALTIKVGVTASAARYNLKDQQEVVGFLDHLLRGDR